MYFVELLPPSTCESGSLSPSLVNQPPIVVQLARNRVSFKRSRFVFYSYVAVGFQWSVGRGGGDCSFTAPGGRLCNPQYQDLINPHLLFTSSNKSFRIGSPLLFARVRRNERFVHLQLLPLFYTCVLFFRLCRLFCSSRQYRFIVLVLYVTFTRVELGF